MNSLRGIACSSAVFVLAPLVWSCGGGPFTLASTALGAPSDSGMMDEIGLADWSSSGPDVSADIDASVPGCTKDTDCKGDRICITGECVPTIAPIDASDGAPQWDGGACTSYTAQNCGVIPRDGAVRTVYVCTQGRTPSDTACVSDPQWFTGAVDPGTTAWCCP